MNETKIEKIQRLLLEDDFTKFVARNGHKFYIIDSANEGFHSIPNVIGCFNMDGRWVTYQVDNDLEIYDIGVFENQIDAYQNAVSKEYLEYEPSELINNVINNPEEALTSEENQEVLFKSILNIIHKMRLSRNFYHTKNEEYLYEDDLAFLEDLKMPIEIQNSKTRK